MAEILTEVAARLGMAIEEGDFNDAQRFVRAALWDAVVGNIAQDWSETPGSQAGQVADSRVFTLGAGAYPKSDLNADRTITNAAGVLAYRAAAITGRDQEFRAVYVPADAIRYQVGVGDPVNPRIDAVGVKIDWLDEDQQARDFEDGAGNKSSQNFLVKRSPKLSSVVAVGTPAAPGALTEPALPAGYRRWASVLVPANYGAAALDPYAGHIRDHRLPVGRRIQAFTFGDSFTKSIGFAGNPVGHLVAGAGPDICYALFPVAAGGAWCNARALAVRIDADRPNIKIEVGRLDLLTGGFVILRQLGPGAGTYCELNFQGSTAPSDYQVEPCWGNGYPAGMAVNVASIQPGALTSREVLAVRFEGQAPGATIRCVRWDALVA